jgi:2-amino-4-hydroxy-6-hydroxymethyldihydropteridine diphosphokinase
MAMKWRRRTEAARDAAAAAAAAANERVFVALGGNLGDVFAAMRAALRSLRRIGGTEVIATSWLYRSAPVDADGPDFLNAVVELRTRLEPQALLERLLDLEARFGRPRDDSRHLRSVRHEARTLDLDLLMVGERRIDTPTLQVPHPRMHQRAFVLAPLSDIAPELALHDGRTVAQALAQMPGVPLQRLVPLETT